MLSLIIRSSIIKLNLHPWTGLGHPPGDVTSVSYRVLVIKRGQGGLNQTETKLDLISGLGI